MEEVDIAIMVIQLTTDGTVGVRYDGSGSPVGQSVEVLRWGDFPACFTVIEWSYDPLERVDSVRRFLEIYLPLPWAKRNYWELPLPAP